MSTLTHIGITCTKADTPTVLDLNAKLNLRLVRKSVGSEFFSLFTVTKEDISTVDVFKIAKHFTDAKWRSPEACTLIVEDTKRANLCFVTVSGEISIY